MSFSKFSALKAVEIIIAPYDTTFSVSRSTHIYSCMEMKTFLSFKYRVEFSHQALTYLLLFFDGKT
jgi:hypothetical protein